MNHCCPRTRTIELDNFGGSNIAIISLGTQNAKEGRQIADEPGVSIYTMADVETRGIVKVTEDAISVAKK